MSISKSFFDTLFIYLFILKREVIIISLYNKSINGFRFIDDHSKKETMEKVTRWTQYINAPFIQS